METKKVRLDQLFAKIRGLSEDYEIDDTEADVLLVKSKDLASFSEELTKIVADFVKAEVMAEDETEDEEDDFYVTDFFDDDLD